MPTYVYACKDCGHGLEVVQSFTDEALTVCPECQGALRKKFNSVGVVFKGSGSTATIRVRPPVRRTPAASSAPASAPAPAAAPVPAASSA